MTKQYCLFITVDKRSTFVNIDYTFLNEIMTTEEFIFNTKSIFKTLYSQIRLFFKILFNFKRIKFSYSTFADYHSLFPALFAKFLNKPFYVILGGSDSNYLKKYNYGNIYGPFGYRKLCVKLTLKWSTHLFPVTKSLLYYKNTYLPNELYEYGIRTIVKNFKTPFTVVKNAIIEKDWFVQEKRSFFITIANIKNERSFYLKGIDLFIDIAKALPMYSFKVIGMNKNMARRYLNIKNLELLPFTNQADFKVLLSKAKVFCLFSYTEGCPNVLLESMATGCIPVVSDVSDNRNVVQKYGYLLKKKILSNAKILCEQAITDTEKKGLEISNYIKQKYSSQKRRQFLDDLVAEKYRRITN